MHPDTSMRKDALAVILAASLTLLVALAGCNSPVSDIPDGTVVLTFDDAARTHLTLVAPLLKEHGFGATFFATAAYMGDPENYLSFPEIAEIHRMGFEVGNHSFDAYDYSDRRTTTVMEANLYLLDSELRAVGIPTPRVFAWPGNGFGPEAREILEKRGTILARRGGQPEQAPDSLAVGSAYDPSRIDPLLIPTTINVNPGHTLDHFREAIAKARDGRAVVFEFHGVPDGGNPDVSIDPALFRRVLDLLAEEECNVVGLGELTKWISPEPRPEDPAVTMRWPSN